MRFHTRSTTPVSVSKTMTRRPRLGALAAVGLLSSLTVTLGGGPAFAAPATPSSEATAPELQSRFEESFEQDGVHVTLRMQPVDPSPGHGLREGEDMRFEVEIRDASGRPMSGAFPAAWMDRLPADDDTAAATADKTCKDKLSGFISGSLLFQPELDLNVYYVLTLNHDASLSVVDPLFGFGGSKLLDMVLLEAPGFDWALTPDQTRLFVSMPEADGVAVVDTATWQVLTKLRIGPRPTRLALQGDGSHLWVTYGAEDGTDAGVAVVRVASLRTRADLKLADVAAAAAPALPMENALSLKDTVPDLTFSEDQDLAFLTRPRRGGVAVIDGRRLELIGHVETGPRPTSLDRSSAARMTYVAHEDGSVVVIGGGAEPRIVARMSGEAGPGPLRFAPGGRYGFMPVPSADVIHIVDAAKNRIVQTADVEDGPDQVTFSNELAYVRHQGSEIVLTVPLAQIGQEGAAVPVIDFPGGQAPPGRMERATVAEGIVQAPGADAVLIANSEDKKIYFYKEGMAAPMGTFKNYGRSPRAVEVVDRSLKERRQGVYATEAALRRPGTYDIAFFMDAPRTMHCFRVEVAPNEELAAARRRARPLLVEASPVETAAVGQATRVTFTLRDPHTEEPVDGLEDVTILTFRAPGTWQQRQAARALGQGRYEATFDPPESGVYYAFVGVPSRGLGMEQARPLIFSVEGDEAPVQGP